MKFTSALILTFALSLAPRVWAQSSSGSSAMAMASAGTSIAMSAYMIHQGMPTCPGWGCIEVAAGTLGVLSSAMALKGDSSSNGAVCNPGDTSCGGGFNVTPPPCTDPTNPACSGGGMPGPGTDGLNGLSSATTDANNALDKLKAAGYNVDPKAGTITTPKGTFPASVLASGDSLANAGLIPKADASKYNAMLKSLQSKFRVVGMAIKSGGGGGGASGGTTYQYYDPNAGLGKLKVGPAQKSGLTRELASGELIGAQVDDIFAMVHRQYVKKAEEKTFVGE